MAKDNPRFVFPMNYTQFGILFGCEYNHPTVTSKGLLQGDDPFTHSFIAFSMQFGTAIFMSACLRRMLRILNQPRFVAEMLTAIILGPSVLEHFNNRLFQDFYVVKQTAMMTFFEFFSLFMYLYLIGIQTDLNVIRSSGKLGWILGITGFALPNIITNITCKILAMYHPKHALGLEHIAIFSPITSFHVIVLLLQDVKLLNSEIGRLAVSSALISSILNWIHTSIRTLIMMGILFKFTAVDYLKYSGPRLLYILLAIFGIRPMFYWIIKWIPEGKSLKQWQFLAMIMMLFAVGFCTESLGFTAYFGAIVLGLVVPTGPPLGSGMIEKANLFVSGVLVPSYLLVTGHFVNVFLVEASSCWIILIVSSGSAMGKILAAVVPMKIFGVPNKDAFALGLILSSQGLFDVIVVKTLFTYYLITQEFFTVLTLMITLNAFIGTPILGYIYDPSKRYINYKRRTIQHSRHGAEFKILACIHEEDNVFGLINLVKATYPTKKTPVIMYAIDLMELVGRITPIFFNHQYHKHRSPSAKTNRTDRIISSLQRLEAHHKGLKRYNFTAIAPYNSMHDEICTLALKKNVSFLVIPFHKLDPIPVRGMKGQVLDKAPCSVGILVEKKLVLSQRANLHVCVVFLGGPDAREALAYAMRMLENPMTKLTVIRMIAAEEFITDLLETKLDVRLITELKSLYSDEIRIQYKEVIVKDGAQTIEVLRLIDDQYDFMLVGRRIDAHSPLVVGLADWTYAPELGIVGDILSSRDVKSTASVLVIQQQFTIEDLLQIN